MYQGLETRDQLIPDALEVPRQAGEESNARIVESVLAPAFAERRLFELMIGWTS
jgi:hypothetical protein